MSVCMAYVLYTEYLFEWSYRLKIGAIYMTAVVISFCRCILYLPG